MNTTQIRDVIAAQILDEHDAPDAWSFKYADGLIHQPCIGIRTPDEYCDVLVLFHDDRVAVIGAWPPSPDFPDDHWYSKGNVGLGLVEYCDPQMDLKLGRVLSGLGVRHAIPTVEHEATSCDFHCLMGGCCGRFLVDGDGCKIPLDPSYDGDNCELLYDAMEGGCYASLDSWFISGDSVVYEIDTEGYKIPLDPVAEEDRLVYGIDEKYCSQMLEDRDVDD